MKANELQIGDLIYVYGQNGNLSTEPHWYVKKVTADWLVDMVRGEEEDRRIAESGITIPAGQLSIGDTKPIPLTEEVFNVNKIHYRLPKNGETFDKEWVIPNGAFHIRQDGYEFWVFEDQVSIRYVHQLQHALRLCGLNDFADNFKV